jgi:hypothetical protein
MSMIGHSIGYGKTKHGKQEHYALKKTDRVRLDIK